MKIILVRHGQSESNIKKEFGGHKDAPLTELGMDQAKKCAKRLKDYKVNKLVSSDLKRAFHTACEINKYHDVDHEVDEQLREMHFGDWEGLTYKEIMADYSHEMKAWEDDFYNYSTPNGENMVDLFTRVTASYNKVISALNKGETCVIVAHGGVIQMLLSYLLHDNMNAYWSYGIDNCGIATIEYVMGKPVLKGLNQ